MQPSECKFFQTGRSGLKFPEDTYANSKQYCLCFSCVVMWLSAIFVVLRSDAAARVDAQIAKVGEEEKSAQKKKARGRGEK